MYAGRFGFKLMEARPLQKWSFDVQIQQNKVAIQRPQPMYQNQDSK